MADSSSLENDAVQLAKAAVEHDIAENYDMAIFYYTEAVEALFQAQTAGSKKPDIMAKAKEYISRAETLKSMTSHSASPTQNVPKPVHTQSQSQSGQDQAQYLLREAMDLDDNNCVNEAIERYTEAIEMLLNLRSKTSDVALQAKLGDLAMKGLDRAEVLKKSKATKASTQEREDPMMNCPEPPPEPPSTGEPRGSHSPAVAVPSAHRQDENRGEAYSAEEIAVLRKTSNINGRIYVPFLQHVDLRTERFAFTSPFTDKDGRLALSAKQRSYLDRWVRPTDYTTDPQMILCISSFSIRQTIVTDCSFVASMAIAAQYEKRFKKKLITNIIYPQNRKGDPVYNPCGKYMVKLHINGVPRKVIIDDFLPMSSDGELLCSYSTNRNELWVSLLEKAYMKVMGGYDFPGSNSNIDLHALTGWIPERVAMKSGSLEFNKDKEFRRLLKKFHQGHCLITVATGEMDEDDAKRAGLVPTHAYAMLDIREVEGQRLFLLKNPWSHLRWRGNFSERDTARWTPQMQKALNFDLNGARLTDNGVFWIDYDSLCHFFDVIYVNWDPELFRHTSCIHSTWSSDTGARKDVYTVRDNPQYKLWVKQGSAVWILLTRHITDKEDFADNREFMAVVVYRGISTRRVYYPGDPPPYRDGVRINSPHNLVKLVLDDLVADTAVNGWQCLHLVVSQYEKQNTLHYTLRAFSSAEMRFQAIVDPYKCVRTETGKWQGATAGGCGNYPTTYYNNPTFQIRLDNGSTDNSLLLELRGPRDFAVGFELVKVTANNSTAKNNFDKKHCGPYRRGYVVMEVENFSGGVYNLIVSTYKPGEEGPFILKVSSLHQFSVSRLTR